MVGKTLGHYEILEPLGSGGMGEVYRARDTKLERDVAIKVLPEDLAADPDRLARFEREAKLLASLNHSNIGAIHGLEECDGVRFLVLELIEGQTLEQRLLRGRLPVPEALDIAVQIAAALEAAHEEGIIHRDVKPANLLLTPRGGVKVLDFGIAKSTVPDADIAATAQATSLTMDGTLMGTPPYMSPEQIRGGQVDEKTDVWAFGCVLYEMLTGTRAFAAETVSDTLADILTKEPNGGALPKATPDRVRTLLERLFRKDPERRLRHIGDARIELEEARASSSERPSATAPKVLVALLGLAAAGLAAGWYFLGSGGDPAITDRSIAVLPFETLGQEEATVFTQGIHGDLLARLSSIADLKVTSRTSVMRFRGSDMSLPEIARQLGVAWVVAGEVQEVGDQVQVNARLMNARQDRQVWAQSYRRQLTAENLFQIQGELTARIAEQLRARLTPAELRAVERVPTENLEAYRLYVLGRGRLEQRTEDEMRRAADYFQQAIDRDPSYALAWAGLADTVMLLGWYGYLPPQAAPDPELAARQALEYGPNLAEAHASLGIFHAMRQEGPAAIREFERAVELRPSYADAYGWLAWLELVLGRPQEALVPAQRAAELDPWAPWAQAFLAETHLANGEAERALQEARRAREIQPEYGIAHFMEGMVLFHLDRLAEAKSALEIALSLVPPQGTPNHAQVLAILAVIQVASGDSVGAGDLLAQIDATVDPFPAGLVHAALGEHEEAFEAFRRVGEWGQISTEMLRYFFPTILDPLREDPRYDELLREADQSWGLGRR